MSKCLKHSLQSGLNLTNTPPFVLLHLGDHARPTERLWSYCPVSKSNNKWLQTQNCVFLNQINATTNEQIHMPLTLIQQQNKLKVKKDTTQTWTQKQNYNTYTEGVGLLNGGGFFVFASHQWRGCHDISKIRNAVLDTGHTCTGGQYTKHAVHTHQWQGSK